jgi:hypothetical protein
MRVCLYLTSVSISLNFTLSVSREGEISDFLCKNMIIVIEEPRFRKIEIDVNLLSEVLLV